MHNDAFNQAKAIIGAESQALAVLADQLDAPVFGKIVDQILALPGRVIITGVGKSGLIGAKIAATLSSTGTPASFMHMADAGHGDLGIVQSGDLMVILSSSGRSRELVPVLTYCRDTGIKVVAITAKKNTGLANAADFLLLLPDLPEACPLGLAPMSSTSMQLALGDALAGALIEARGFTKQEFARRHLSGSLGLKTMSVSEFIHMQELELGVRKTPLVPLHASINTVVDAITSGQLGATLVADSQEPVENQQSVGLITDGDVRRAILAGNLNAKAAEIMTQQPFCVEGHEPVSEVFAKMRELSLNVVLVKDNNSARTLVLHIHELLKAGL